VVDNGCSHRGQASIDRLEHRWPTLRLIHLPLDASGSTKGLSTSASCNVKSSRPTTSIHSKSHACSKQRYEQIAAPFDWKFTKDDLNALLEPSRPTKTPHSHPPHNGSHDYVTEITYQIT
jgi:hypothetical protein